MVINDVFGRGTGAGSVGIAEISLPGLPAGRTLVLPPAPPAASAPTIVLTAATGTPSCFFIDGHPRCATTIARGSEDAGRLDRTFTLGAAGNLVPSLWARPKSGTELDSLLDRFVTTKHPLQIAPTVAASTTEIADPAGRPGAVVDGDPATAWSPSPTDENPLLHLSWPAPRLVSGVQVSVDPGVAGTRAGAVQVITDEGVRGGLLDATGTVRFSPPVTTDELAILFITASTAQSRDSYSNTTHPLPVAIGEVTVLPDGPQPPIDYDAPMVLPCGSGPDIDLGTTKVATRLVATAADLLQQREVPAVLCGAPKKMVSLVAGEQRLVVTSSNLAEPARLVLAPAAAVPAGEPAAAPLAVGTWTAVERKLTIGPSDIDRVIAVRENSNPGWQATVAGVRLAPLTIDGWQQGWMLPAHVSGQVVLVYAPTGRTASASAPVVCCWLGCCSWPSCRLADRYRLACPRSDRCGVAFVCEEAR